MARLTDEQQLAEHRHMLQLLLEDRFSLRTHWEIKESDIYNLLQGKGGAKLGAAGSMPLSSDELKRFNKSSVPVLYQKNDGRGYDFIAHGCSMDRLADTLTAQFGRSVLNKTNLTGNYDFVLKYKGRSDHDRDPEDLDPMPPIDKALAEELGLRVEAAKGPVKVLIVDHIATFAELALSCPVESLSAYFKRDTGPFVLCASHDTSGRYGKAWKRTGGTLGGEPLGQSRADHRRS